MYADAIPSMVILSESFLGSNFSSGKLRGGTPKMK